MKMYQYKCKLLSDLVIPSSSATEGFNQSLDYIPGAKFMGIVAGKLYKKDKDNSAILDLFYNGKVRYSDAYPLLGGNVGLKVPFKWFHPKGGTITDKIYLHVEDLPKETLKSEQPKQARAGYYIPINDTEGKYLKISQDFSIKSAYNSLKRKSEDAKMYGYFSLPKGTEWSFTITDSTGRYADEIKYVIEGKKRIGRSRSAEYGLVQIDFLSEITSNTAKEAVKGKVYIYAKSNLCFYDENGRNTARPSESQLLLPLNSKILWDRSQIRTRVYQTWNRKRFNRDADRVIIEKGSVIAVQLSESINPSLIEQGIGSHQSEGFGEVLINPNFLMSETPELALKVEELNLDDWRTNYSFFTVKECDKDDLIINYLSRQEKVSKQVLDIDKQVNDFIENHGMFKKVSNSQWGILRNYAKNTENVEHFQKLVFSQEAGFMYRGQSEKVWRAQNKRGILQSYLFDGKSLPKSNIIPFTIKLAAQMAKSK